MLHSDLLAVVSQSMVSVPGSDHSGVYAVYMGMGMPWFNLTVTIEIFSGQCHSKQTIMLLRARYVPASSISDPTRSLCVSVLLCVLL